jgi:hypothetical protein
MERTDGSGEVKSILEGAILMVVIIQVDERRVFIIIMAGKP